MTAQQQTHFIQHHCSMFLSCRFPFPSVDCGPSPQIANATSIGGTFFTSVGDEVRYYCDFGTTLVGNATIVCLDDGTWSDPPMCIPPSEYMN